MSIRIQGINVCKSIFVFMVTVLPGSLAAADIPVNGDSPLPLKVAVSSIAKEFVADQHLPGLAIAVADGDRLILSLGVGYADVDGKVEMQRNTRIPLGSVTKALITGPSAWQALKADPAISRNSRLYGLNGVFKGKFDAQLEQGVKRHQPIVAVAINPNNVVYTWYSNGTVSKGKAADLDSVSNPAPYTLPQGKQPVDIRAIAISKNNRVHVWYDDRTHSVGSSTDLDALSPPGICTSDDKSGCISLPAGKRIQHVVGMAIHKSNNRIYTWYEDGTISIGDTSDLDRHSAPAAFTWGHGSGGTSYNIRGIGISKSNRVYTWFSNRTYSGGTSTDLDFFRAPAPYSYAPIRLSGGEKDWNEWYSSITIQNLFDHKSGFRTADTQGAMKAYNQSEDSISYENIHKHFLLSQKLKFKPDTNTSYSNHNFGLWNVLIPEITGKTYRYYTQNHFLKPLGFKQRIAPVTSALTGRDASGYVLNSQNKLVRTQYNNSNRGLPAGGFKSSAEDAVALMVALEKRYSWNELDSMGWFKNEKGRLSHNGKLDGGTTQARMYPASYTHGGLDYSNLKIVVSTNVRMDTGILADFTYYVLKKTAEIGARSYVNLW